MFLQFYSHWKFTVLLVAALLLLGARMALPDRGDVALLVDLCGVAFLVVGLVTLCDDPKYRRAALIVGCPAVLSGLLSHALPLEESRTIHILARVLATLFLGFTVAVVIRSLIAARSVSWDTIAAALVGYLVLAVTWTQMYCILEIVQPDSFAIEVASQEQLHHFGQRQAVLEYFSLITLSTLGYGDVIPASRPARSLACLEAIIGQFYLAVLVAGLVGMRGTRSEPEEGEG